MPQDVEWTFRRSSIYVLQSRAITTLDSRKGDKRAWYLSLRRSAENLNELRNRIENDLIPRMDAEALRWERKSVQNLDDNQLLKEVLRRYTRYQEWLGRYWDECIPFAHGVRLFGQFYNDVMRPADPYEFVELLTSSELLSIQRNDALQRLANRARADEALLRALNVWEAQAGQESFWAELDTFVSMLSAVIDEQGVTSSGRKAVAGLVVRMAMQPRGKEKTPGRLKDHLEKAFLARFRGNKRREAENLLELGRSSYRLRDDDNIYLGRIARQVDLALGEAKRRGLKLPAPINHSLAMRPTGGQQHAATSGAKTVPCFEVRARQLIGQPAGPGFASGNARIITGPQDLFLFQSGEVLICDAIDPAMTFIMPLAAGIVECRGGMLIHGAIIAREYGIPCLTGIQEALNMIKTGVCVEVDGYLGIVTIG